MKKKLSQKQLLQIDYEKTISKHIEKQYIPIQSLCQLIISYIRLEGIIVDSDLEKQFLGREFVTPLLDGRFAYFCPINIKHIIWNPENDDKDIYDREIELKHIMAIHSCITDIKLLKDGRLVILLSNKCVVIINPYNGNYEDGIEFKNKIKMIKIENKDIIIMIMANNTMNRWNFQTGQNELIYIDLCHCDALGILPKQRIVQPYIFDHTKICITNFETGRYIISSEQHTNDIDDMYVLPNGIIVTTCLDHIIKLWNSDSETITCLLTLVGHTESILDIALLTNGRLLSCSFDQTIKIWNLKTGLCEFDISGIDANFFIVLENGGFLACCNFIEYLLFI